MQHLDIGLEILKNRIVGNGHRAQRHARMNPKGSDAKYSYVKAHDGPEDKDGHHIPITDAQLLDHLAGRSTYAIDVIGADGLVSGACIDIDEDGTEAARRVLAAAAAAGVVAYAINVKGAKGHDGPHIWICYTERVKPADAAHQAQLICTDAGYPKAEIWPAKQGVVRAPFAIHTHSQQRGRLTLQSGETYDLDQPDQLSLGLAAVGALPLNQTPAAAPVVERQARTVAPSGNTRQGESVIDAFNRRYTAEQAIELCGGSKTRDAWACNEPSHNHSNTNNLLITDRGLILAYGPNCYAPQRGAGQHGLTPFGYYCEVLHGGNLKEAVKTAARLLDMPGPKPKAELVQRETPHHSPAQATAYNTSRREQRHAETRQALDQIAEHISQLDFETAIHPGAAREAHSQRAHLVASYLLDRCHSAGVLQIRPTNAEIAAALGFCERYVSAAFKELEANGIGKRQGGRGGKYERDLAIWTFYRALPSLARKEAAPHQEAICDLVYIPEDSYTESDLTCERGAAVEPAREPAEDWECWEACDDGHGADDLVELDLIAGDVIMSPAENKKKQEFSPIGETPPRICHTGPFVYLRYPDGSTSQPFADERVAQLAAGLEDNAPQVADLQDFANLSHVTNCGIPQTVVPDPEQPAAELQNLVAGWRKPGFCDDDQPELAVYDPAHDITDQRQAVEGEEHEVPAWLRVDIGPTPLLDQPEPSDQAAIPLDVFTPRDPARIADPDLRSTYFKLTRKAQKPGTSAAQAKWARNEAARILNGADMLPPGSSSTAPDCPPLTSLPGSGAPAGDPVVERVALAQAKPTTTTRSAPRAGQRSAQQAGLWGAQ